MLVLIVEERSGLWMAYPEGKRAIWEMGKTMTEALGKLLVTLACYPEYAISIHKAGGAEADT